MEKLTFNANNYAVYRTKDKNHFEYRAFVDISYVAKPIDPIQKLNIFAPETYYDGGSINGYTLKTAPIFMPNTVGGYMPGQRDFPDNTAFNNGAQTITAALKRGYIVISAGVRGRSLTNSAGQNIGKAPALIVDLKAAIRYIKFNQATIPGNVERIITNGTSAGGALSALAGVTQNQDSFTPYLAAIGAAPADDRIFAVSAYCPIHNLENADAAYEWQFNEVKEFHRMHINFTQSGKPNFTPWDGQLTKKEQLLSTELKQQFIHYVNQLGLKDTAGNQLTLDSNGQGSFLEVIKQQLLHSAQRALDQGNDLLNYSWLNIRYGKVIGIDWSQYLHFITRMKSVPAFDALDLNSPECNEFCTEQIDAKHFTQFSQTHTTVKSKVADQGVIDLINPIHFIGDQNAVIAKHWRIRHGAADRDTSFAIPTILALFLKNRGVDVDFALPWGKPHSGDYDLPELFTWIDNLCQ